MRLEKDARRQQLINAATRVFARFGYTQTDVSAVVAEARVVRGTFYLYFQAKRDIFLAIVDQYLDLLRRQAEQPRPPAEQPLRDQLAISFAQALRLHAEHRDLALVVLRDGWSADPESAERLRAAGDLAKATMAGTYAALSQAGWLRAIDSHLVATAVGGLLREVLLHEILLKGRVAEIDQIADELASFVYQGLVATVE